MHAIRSRRLPLLALATVGLLHPQTRASEVTGRVNLPGRGAARVVVSIEGVKAGEARQDVVQVMDHRDLSFTPEVLIVRTGDTVRFVNSDGMPCRIYSASRAGNFVLGRKNRGSNAIRFERPGVIEVRCADHARIRAFILVKENPFFAITDANGAYTIRDIPEGHYTLQAWSAGRVIRRRTIDVRDGTQIVDLSESHPRRRSPQEENHEK